MQPLALTFPLPVLALTECRRRLCRQLLLSRRDRGGMPIKALRPLG
jgi:hypothetical protein